MTPAQATTILDVLQAAFPSKAGRTAAVNLYSTLLVELDYDLASKAVRTIIDESAFWPKWAEIKRAYREHLAAQRYEAEHAEVAALLIEPTEAERLKQLERMRDYIADRWAKP